MKSKSELIEIHQKIVSLVISKSIPSPRAWNFISRAFNLVSKTYILQASMGLALPYFKKQINART